MSRASSRCTSEKRSVLPGFLPNDRPIPDGLRSTIGPGYLGRLAPTCSWLMANVALMSIRRNCCERGWMNYLGRRAALQHAGPLLDLELSAVLVGDPQRCLAAASPGGTGAWIPVLRRNGRTLRRALGAACGENIGCREAKFLDQAMNGGKRLAHLGFSGSFDLCFEVLALSEEVFVAWHIGFQKIKVGPSRIVATGHE